MPAVTDADLRAWLEQWEPPAGPFELVPHIEVLNGALLKAATLAHMAGAGQVRRAAWSKARSLYERFNDHGSDP